VITGNLAPYFRAYRQAANPLAALKPLGEALAAR
jgi:hypothetical protein